MNEKVLLLSEEDMSHILGDGEIDIIKETENALVRSGNGQYLIPEKISQVFDKTMQTRINCMPATLLPEKICGLKWVSVFPTNAARGMNNVAGTLLLSEIDSGKLISVCGATELTAVRTAAVGAVATKYLAKSSAKRIGFIGAGAEAKAHLCQIKKVCPQIRECAVASRTEATERAFLRDMQQQFPNISFELCHGNFRQAARGADIVVTATSSQRKLFKKEWVEEGMLYIHVGGVEDEFGVAARADKIVCDDWEAVKHRAQTLSQMYHEGYLTDQDIYGNIYEIISGKKAGRENDREFIYFDSVGMASTDVYLGYCAYQYAKKKNMGLYFCMDERRKL